MFDKNRFRRCNNPFREIILPVVLITAGTFLILFFTPPWLWFFILGIAFIIVGSHILRKWR